MNEWGYWVILTAILELFSTKRVPIYLHLIALAKPVSNALNRIGETVVRNKTRATISELVGVPNDKDLANLCEKHNYNKLAVLRECLFSAARAHFVK